MNGTVYSNSNEGTMTPYIALTLAPDEYYNYNVSGPEGFNATPSSGSLQLSGNKTVQITFTQNGLPFSVTFEEVGLYYNTTHWSVTFDGREITSTNYTITFTGVGNGTYQWIVDSSNVSTGPGTYYAPEIISGNLTVPNQLTVVVKYDQYSRVLVAPNDPEFGSTSPSGWHWYRESPAPTTLNISASPLNGSYFTRWTFNGPGMVANYSAEDTTMTVYGPGVETAEFVTNVTLQSAGLPSNASPQPGWWWYATIYRTSSGEELGNTLSNLGSYDSLRAYGNQSVSFLATNGTYRYVISAANINGTYYSPVTINGTIDVQSSSPTYTVQFKPGVPVTLNDTGLPGGTSWSIEVNDSTYNLRAGEAETIYLPPGEMLSYEILPVVGYDIQNQSGTMVLPYAPSNYTVNFYPASPVGRISSEYSGYFYSGIPVENVFGFNGSWGSAAPTGVYGQIGASTMWFEQTSSGMWVSNQFDMGSLSSNTTLEVYVTYANQSVLNYTYPVQVIHSPWWLTNLSSSDAVTMSISQPYQQWNNSYCINFTSVLDTGSQLTVNVDAGLVSGSYQVVPNIPFTLTLSSAGTAELSSTINPGEISVDLGSATVQVSGSFGIKGSFAASQGTLVWESASVELKMDTMAQTSVPLASVGIPGTDMNVGFNLQIGFGPDFTLILHLVPTSNGQYEITPGVPIEVSNTTLGLGATISLYVNAQVKEGIDWASVAGGGSLTFMQYMSTPPFVDLGGDITGTVSIKATIVDVQYTVWSTSGTIYTWGTVPDPSQNNATVGYVQTYFNGSDYSSITWMNGSWSGPMVTDVYPMTSISTSPGPSGDYLLYTYYNVSRGPSNPLSAVGLVVGADRNTSSISMPAYGEYQSFNAQVFQLPNGTPLLLWDGVPYGEINVSNISSVDRILVQGSALEGGAWSPPFNVTSSGVANDYSYSDGYVLAAVAPNISYYNRTTIQEYALGDGAPLLSIPVHNVSNIDYFNHELSYAILRFDNSSYASLDLSTGSVTPLVAPGNGTILQVGAAENTTQLYYELVSSPSMPGDELYLYNATSGSMIYSQGVPQDAYPATFIYGGDAYSALVTRADPHGIDVYMVNLGTGTGFLYRQIPDNSSSYVAASSEFGKLYIYSLDQYGNITEPLYNVTSFIVPLPPPPPSLGLSYNGSSIGVSWSVPDAGLYNVTSVEVYAGNGSTGQPLGTFNGSAGSLSYPVNSSGDYWFTAYSLSPFGESSSSSSHMGMYWANFSEGGLPSGATWTVRVAGTSSYGQAISTSRTTSAGSMELLLPPGLYTFYASSSTGYTARPGSGSMNLGPPGFSSRISFSPPTYTVTFSETGLTSGAGWWVEFDGANGSSTSGTIQFTGVTAGTYGWEAASVVYTGPWIRYLASTSSGYMSVPTATSQVISYAEQFHVSANSTYGGTVSAVGGWYGVNSTVPITATASPGYRFYEWSSSSPSISIANASSPSTTMKVGGPGTVTALFIQVLQSTVSISPASGAPGTTVSVSGSSFYPNSTVTVYYDGTSVGSVTASAAGSFSTSFTVPSLPNGTYTIEAIDSYGDSATASFAESTMPVQGAAVNSTSSTVYIENGTAMINATSSVGVSITILNASVPDNYPVSVSESMLSGVPANVTPTTVKASGYYDVRVVGLTAGIVLVNITNPYISPGANVTLEYWNGSTWVGASDITVSGHTVSGYISVQYLSGTPIAVIVTYTVTFSETGIPSGTPWSVTFNGATESSSTGTIAYAGVPPGNYSWSAQSIVPVSQSERASSTGSASGTLDLTSNAQVSVPYVVQYAVSFESIPGNGGTTYPNETEWVNVGSGIQVQATPAHGYRFVGWATNTNYSVSFENASAPYTTATVNSAGVIAAEFKQIPSYTLEYAIAAAVVIAVVVAALERARRRHRIGASS
ncbi:Predicted cell-wall-anchored protein SasA [Conexivisphaera calida]|uniref:Predicted cell-wall-anchored protein SasA n=1 Tax=Conexivisphaera calida TaxID=1874277 RepID=A0A4P2VCD0_9ARCH|nr:Predicted cell-wall-anchored protein SasA [Conexivisphaera calida]